MLRTRGVGGVGWVGWGGMLINVHVNDDDDTNADADDDDDDDVMMMMMLMMMMTLMKLVNSATKFHHGMDKFYQPNSGLRGSKSRDEAIYTYNIHVQIIVHQKKNASSHLSM